MSVVIRAVAHANGTPCGVSGLYLSRFDPASYDGRGAASWTPEPEGAMHFDTRAAAFAFWQQITGVRNGKPMRPLTAYTVEIINA
jgi:hypothetical protein